MLKESALANRGTQNLISLTLAAIIATAIATPLFAQEATADEEAADEIIVTGSIVAAQESSIRAKREALNLVDVAAADKVKVPLLASGGIADGRGLVAALALGADGINMGTRFCATQEAQIHPNVKQAYLDNDERGTLLLFRKLNNSARVGRNSVAEEVVRLLDARDSTFEDVAHLVAGAKGRELLSNGDLNHGVYWASMALGLIHDLPTCTDLIDRIMADAEAIITSRLSGMTVAD